MASYNIKGLLIQLKFRVGECKQRSGPQAEVGKRCDAVNVYQVEIARHAVQQNLNFSGLNV